MFIGIHLDIIHLDIIKLLDINAIEKTKSPNLRSEVHAHDLRIDQQFTFLF